MSPPPSQPPATASHSRAPNDVAKAAPPARAGPTKTIWMWWNSGEASLPPFLRACVASWRAQHPGWRVVVLSEANLWDYLESADLPGTFAAIRRKSLQSDLVRLAVLARHGGVYVDLSSLALMGYAEAAWELLSSGAAQFVGFRSPSFISDFVAAWFIAVLPGQPLVLEWSRKLNALFEDRVCDTGVHQDPFFDGVDLSEYAGQRNQCAGGCWADYLVVNVVLKAILDGDPERKAAFFASALLVDEADLERSPVCWNQLVEAPIELRFPERERLQMRKLLQDEPTLLESLSRLPMLKFFNSGSSFAELSGEDLLGGRSVIARLVQLAVGEAELRQLFRTIEEPMADPKSELSPVSMATACRSGGLEESRGTAALCAAAE